MCKKNKKKERKVVEASKTLYVALDLSLYCQSEFKSLLLFLIFSFITE